MTARPGWLTRRGSSISANPAGAQPRSTSEQPNLPSRLDRGEHRHTIKGGGTPLPTTRSTTCLHRHLDKLRSDKLLSSHDRSADTMSAEKTDHKKDNRYWSGVGGEKSHSGQTR